MSDAPKSYGQILKSSALLGSSSAVIAVVGLLRNKAITLIMGTSGAGWWSLCWSISELARSIAGVGINNSGVRQIAASVATGDHQKIARTVVTLRRVSLVLGIVGALALAALCVPVARYYFKDEALAGVVVLVALTVLFSTISQGQTALLQGMRRVGDYARNSLLGAVLGAAVSIPVIYVLFKREVNPAFTIAVALVCVSMLAALASWWYARKIKVEAVPLSSREVTEEARALLKLGFIFMLSGVMMQGVMAAVTFILHHTMDENAVGLYGQAWMLSGYLVGFVFQAMGTDYYPRLTAVANDNPRCNQLVNEQTEVGMLLAGPALLATLTGAPWLLQLVASSQFLPATEVLRWFCLGMLLRAFSWPMAFVMMAKNAQKLFFWTELFSNVLYIALVWFGVARFGLNGVGMAFVALYAVYAAVAYLIVRHLSDFRWSRENLLIASVYGLLAVGMFIACKFLIPVVALGIGIVVTAITGIFSVKKLCALIPPERFPRRARQLLMQLRLLPASTNL
ncbi:MAG: oligosaccharide flippase family protein [Verrucomicrobiota bacterium]